MNKSRKGSGPSRLSKTSNPTFGAVSTITTAPVAIGNSMRGVKAQVVNMNSGGVRVVGRDYAFTAFSTGPLITNWFPVGGFPLSPACFVSSIIRSYVQIYNKFKFNKLVVHYITSSPTSTNGDVMFAINKNRSDPAANYTASSFLNYTLSDPHTVIGPQWTNHSASITPTGPFRNISAGANNDIDYQAQGEVMLYSKTSSTDSPGYVLIDYDISFAELSVTPRAGLFPNPNMIFTPFNFMMYAASYTSASTVARFSAQGLDPGYTLVGQSATAITPLSSTPYWRNDDIYKIVLDMSKATYTVTSGTTPTASTLLCQLINSGSPYVDLTDGYTLYACTRASTDIRLFATLANAFSNTDPLYSGTTSTYPANVYVSDALTTTGVNLFGIASWVGNQRADNLQQQ